MCGLTFELTPTVEAGAVSLARDDARVPRARLTAPAVAGRGVERGVRPRYFAKGWVHHCCSHGVPSRFPSIFTPGQLAKKNLASLHDRICEQYVRPSQR